MISFPHFRFSIISKIEASYIEHFRKLQIWNPNHNPEFPHFNQKSIEFQVLECEYIDT